MKELVKITEENGKKLVSARELHEVLEVKTQFKDWCKRKIDTNPYFIENEDFTRVLNFERAGQSALEFALTLNTAKKISMLENTDKGNEVREYFIACEKKLQEATQFQIPQSYADALQLAANQAKQLESQEAELKELKPKGEFYDAVTGSEDTIDIGSVAKVLNMGIGRNKLFQLLRDKSILMRNNQPYQNYIDRGYFRTVEVEYNKPDGSTHINIKTVVFQKGVRFIKKIIETNIYEERL